MTVPKNLTREFNWSPPAHWAGVPVAMASLDPMLLGNLLDHISARVAVIGPDHCYLYANREALAFYKLPAERVIGHHLSEILGQSSYEGYLPWAERLFAGESLSWKGWLLFPTLGYRFLQETMVPFLPAGHAAGQAASAIVVYGRDYTDLKNREEELLEKELRLDASEALKSAIVDHALAALISTDDEGCIVEFNPAAQAMSGFTRDAVLGRRVSEVLTPARYRAAHDAGMLRVKNGEPDRMLGKRQEMWALRADGSEFPMEMVLWRSRVAGATFYTASLTDLSERHRARHEIERYRDALRQSEKLTTMGSLLAGVAHELNNPLAVVMGRASLLEEKCESAQATDLPQLQADARLIREAAQRCAGIVRTFLNMARQRPSAPSPVGLNTMVRSAIDMLGYGFRSHGIEAQQFLANDLPDVLADPDQIGQIVMNLLVNAQQALATHPGPRRVRVQTGTEASQDGGAARVWLRVADNGPGVSDWVQRQIFERCFTTKPEGLGTGLGLTVSRALAQSAGGDLFLEQASALGGASFRLDLPACADDTRHAPQPALTVARALMAVPSTSTPLRPGPASRSRVLVIDDEHALAELMRDMLECIGLEVVTAESGAVALELLAAADFGAVVSDLRMPDMDGPTLRAHITRLYPALAQRMLFVTGDTLSQGAQEFLRLSGAQSLDKPFDMADLQRSVIDLLQRA